MSLLTHSLVITSLSLLCTVVGVAGSVTAATRWRLPHGCAAMAQHQPSWQGWQVRGGGEANRRRVGQRVDESADDGHAEDVRGLSASPGFLCGGKKLERPCDIFLLVHSVLPALSISEIWVLTQLMTEVKNAAVALFQWKRRLSSVHRDTVCASPMTFYWKMRTLLLNVV